MAALNIDQPLAYKKGWVEFYKLRFKVTPDVLIPRPETELLVDEVISFVNRASLIANRETETSLAIDYKRSPITILDLGTGSGCIAISIAKNLQSYPPTSDVGARIIASDVSEKALKVARQNAKLHQVQDKIEFVQSNLLSAFCHSESRHRRTKNLLRMQDDLIIVTNLPYIPSARIPYLDSSVKDFEPHVALDGGEDGFELYRKLFEQIRDKGWKPKLIIGEIDYTQGELAVIEALRFFPQSRAEVKTDLAHRQRILTIIGEGLQI